MSKRPTVGAVVVRLTSGGPIFAGHFHPNCLVDGELRLTTAGGGIENDEPVHVAAAREVCEEYGPVGVDKKPLRIEARPLELGPMRSGDKVYSWCLVVFPTPAVIVPDPDEVYAPSWYGGQGGLDYMLGLMSPPKRTMYRMALSKALRDPRLRPYAGLLL
jgi:8-oxo-dGTP pyrophosphatase MutT (NUDIX family)